MSECKICGKNTDAMCGVHTCDRTPKEEKMTSDEAVSYLHKECGKYSINLESPSDDYPQWWATAIVKDVVVTGEGETIPEAVDQLRVKVNHIETYGGSNESTETRT